MYPYKRNLWDNLILQSPEILFLHDWIDLVQTNAVHITIVLLNSFFVLRILHLYDIQLYIRFSRTLMRCLQKNLSFVLSIVTIFTCEEQYLHLSIVFIANKLYNCTNKYKRNVQFTCEICKLLAVNFKSVITISCYLGNFLAHCETIAIRNYIIYYNFVSKFSKEGRFRFSVRMKKFIILIFYSSQG